MHANIVDSRVILFICHNKNIMVLGAEPSMSFGYGEVAMRTGNTRGESVINT